MKLKSVFCGYLKHSSFHSSYQRGAWCHTLKVSVNAVRENVNKTKDCCLK